jgi:lysyl-tRNA synthetase class 2
MGVEPYPYRFNKEHLAADLHSNFDALAEFGKKVQFAGRLMGKREHGRSVFGDLQDHTGQVQIYVREEIVGSEQFELFAKFIDIGDMLGVAGACFRTKLGEPTLRVESFEILAKGLCPMPEKWHGLVDIEMRYRQRYLDLICNEAARMTFVKRAQITNIVRRVFNDIGGLEVETPTLQPLYGGAAAKPFTTFHNALNMTMYLRIAPELYLKRLIVGGFECVYEICKDFRNEGMDRQHNPEFTMVEIYWAYHDYNDMMDLTEHLFCEIAQELYGSTVITYQDQSLNFTPPWPRRSMIEMVSSALGHDIGCLSLEELRTLTRQIAEQAAASQESGGKVPHRLDQMLWGEMIAELFDLSCGSMLRDPVFVTDFPKDVSPLAKVHRADLRLTERFELYIYGREMANAFSELNDPIDQRQRFVVEMEKKRQGDQEAHPLDEDFLRALEYGMPPCGGLGIGIDRLVMLFTNQVAIQDVILFPHLRPEPNLSSDVDSEKQ